MKRESRQHLDVKETVRRQYGDIAAGRTGGCCGDKSAHAAALQIGYESQDLDAVPEGANLGLGCGNPTAIAALQPGETVVDLGSGAGFDCFLAARQVGSSGRVIGVDMTDEMLAKARQNAEKGSFTNVEFRKGEIEALPLEDASVDVVISNCVLNLVPDKRKAFSEIVRVLKPGGRLAVSDIVLERPLPIEIQEDPAAYAGCISGAILRDDYLRLLSASGLSGVHVTQEADASGILLESPGPVSDVLRGCCGTADLRGLVTSIHVEARRPGGPGE
jgi:arsenite methyltransferase